MCFIHILVGQRMVLRSERAAAQELGGHGDAHLGCPGLFSFSVVVGWEDLCEAACFTWLRSAAWLLESVLRVHASTC